MDNDDDFSGTSIEIGSDELLSDDNLRLPESASTLVRTHAVQAWLTRRHEVLFGRQSRFDRHEPR